MVTRIITALVLFVWAVTCIILGKSYIISFLFFFSMLAVFEFSDILKKANYKVNMLANLIGMGLFYISLYLFDYRFLTTQLFYKIIPLLIIGFLLFELYKKHIFLVNTPVFLFLRTVICFSFLSYIVFLREMENGLVILFFVVILIWASDSFAYFGGKLFGKHQLTSISPKKTIEGTVISILMVLLLALIFIVAFKLAFWKFLIAAFLISILAPLGDLHESLTKRFLHIKDSSHILPGHGGVYDRIDSSLFVAPILFIFLSTF